MCGLTQLKKRKRSPIASFLPKSPYRKQETMRYLGGISGNGMLVCGGKEVSRASYDFDGYLVRARDVISCGEIRLRASKLKDVFGRDDVQIRTDDGRILDLRFSEKNLELTNNAAHVDVRGDLPATWRESWRSH